MGLTDDRNHPELTHGVDSEPTEQAKIYLVLSEAERAAGFVRPVRQSYMHSSCGTHTFMAVAIAETYAKEPGFYGSTWCCGCRMHLPVGIHGDFFWLDGNGNKTLERVGT